MKPNSEKLFWGAAIAVGLVVVILIPVIIYKVFEGYSDSASWLGFLGSYCGGIVGALAALVGIAITIRYTKHENDESKRLQWMPHLDVKFERADFFVVPQGTVACVIASRDVLHDDDDKHPACGLLKLKNVGNGPAVNINVECSDFDASNKYAPVLLASETKELMSTTIEAKSEGAISFFLEFHYRDLTENDFEEGDFGRSISYTALSECINFKFHLNLSYEDILGNSYTQLFRFGVSTSICLPNNNSEAYFEPCVYLSDYNAAVRTGGPKD